MGDLASVTFEVLVPKDVALGLLATGCALALFALVLVIRSTRNRDK
ncbi:MAG: hypothetical protein ACKVWV_20365 [Planctomycetota bacterium]